MDARGHELWADRLAAATAEGVPIDALTAQEPGLTVADAYAIQMAGVSRRIEAGARVIGRKIGLTSKAMQDLLKVSEPDFGHLMADMLLAPGEPAPMARLLQPKAEGEIAFLLGRDLEGPGVTIADVLAATEAVMPAIEIVDSRVRDWKIKIQDTVADNASSALLALGAQLTSPRDLDLRLLGMLLYKNGVLVSTGAGAAILGHPATAVAWLANKLSELNTPLRAGEIVLSGAITAAPPAAAGDRFEVCFERLGGVSVRFV
jgi:2-keto-4-pentenoate hydratase